MNERMTDSKPTKLQIGSSGGKRDGYKLMSQRPGPGVDLVCQPWNINTKESDWDAIYSPFEIQYLAYDEAYHAIRQWFLGLRVGGKLEIVVDDVVALLTSTDQALDDSVKEALFGTQEECTPHALGYNQMYRFVKKSGYDQATLKKYLEDSGFTEIEVSAQKIDNRPVLVAMAKKSISAMERQVSPRLEGVRADHKARYEFAAEQLADKNPSIVVDAACGIGYGAYILAQALPSAKIIAFDIDEESLEYGAKYYALPNIEFRKQDLGSERFPISEADAVVSFETLEHLEDEDFFLESIHKALKAGGAFFCSSPNEEVYPFDKEVVPYHVRHHTDKQMSELMAKHGFSVDAFHTQADRNLGFVIPGSHGLYHLLSCTKKNA